MDAYRIDTETGKVYVRFREGYKIIWNKRNGENIRESGFSRIKMVLSEINGITIGRIFFNDEREEGYIDSAAIYVKDANEYAKKFIETIRNIYKVKNGIIYLDNCDPKHFLHLFRVFVY